MSKPIPTKGTKPRKTSKPSNEPQSSSRRQSSVSPSRRQSAVAVVNEETIVDADAPLMDTHKAKRSLLPRDIAIVVALHKTLHVAEHVHDPIDPQEADRIFAFAGKGLADQMLLPILTSGLHLLEDGDLSFQRDTEPIASPSDRHASKVVRKRIKRRKQSYIPAPKTSIYGNYAASRTSSRGESRFGGSRLGSRASASVRGASPGSKMPKMSLIYGLTSEPLSWIGSQLGSIDTDRNNATRFSDTKKSSPPTSVVGTARVAVDFVELQRRADIERDLNTRESVRRSNDELDRKHDLRLKLRSLADPTVSLDEEEAMLRALGAKGQRSRLQQSRQGTRGKAPGLPLSPLNGKRNGQATNIMTFRNEDYEGLTSDVVLLGKDGELLVGENCFVVEQRLRQELLLDLQTGAVVQPRIQLVSTPEPEDESTSGKHSPKMPRKGRHHLHSSSPPSRPPEVPTPFGGQIGSFESSPSLAFDFQGTPLSKGVVVKLSDAPPSSTQASKNRNGPPRKVSTHTPIPESVPNAKLEKQLSALIRVPDVIKPVLAASQRDLVVQTPKDSLANTPSAPSALGVQTSEVAKSSGTGGSALPKHYQDNGERHLQSLRIRTPACPNRLSRKTNSRSCAFVDDNEYSWDAEGDTDNLFSLHQQHSSTSSLPNVKYVREFPKAPPGRIQLFGASTPDTDWKSSTPSSYLFPATVVPKR